jgi:hypothetical protein
MIIHLYRSDVRVMDGLKYVRIVLASYPRVSQVIDIIIVDIPKAYGLLLSRDWSQNM